MSKLRGNPNWKEENRLKPTFMRMKKLNAQIARFEEKCKELKAAKVKYLEEKIENLRVNWQIDRKIEELEELKRALKGEDNIDEQIEAIKDLPTVLSEDEQKKNEDLLKDYFTKNVPGFNDIDPNDKGEEN